MLTWFGPRIRHPFYPEIPATPAAEAKGSVLAVSGTLNELDEAAESRVTARRAVFVIHRWNQLLLNDAQRDHMWNLFQVPVYAILLDSWGSLVAYECEAQNGLHMAADVIESAMCNCGRPGMRPSPMQAWGGSCGSATEAILERERIAQPA
jgi:hypothetical protein